MVHHREAAALSLIFPSRTHPFHDVDPAPFQDHHGHHGTDGLPTLLRLLI